MADKETKTKTEVKKDAKVVETMPVQDSNITESKETEVVTSADTQTTEKSEDKKKEKKPEQNLKRKYEAIANASGLPISLKHSKYICAMINGMSIDKAIADLEKVTKLKKIVPYKGEIPHKKGKGMMSGRYPIKASTYFITLLKGLKGNAVQHQMDLDKTSITIASPSWARRPMRKGNRKGKRVNVIMKVTEKTSDSKEKKDKALESKTNKEASTN